MRSRLSVLRQLHSAADVCLFVRILCFAGVVPVLARSKLSTLSTVLEPGPVRPGAITGTPEKIVAYVESVFQACGPFIRRGCLTRGITLYYFLRRAGVNVTLCFGIGKVENGFAGHCWLVRDGRPFLEPSDPRPMFTPIYTIPGQGSLSP